MSSAPPLSGVIGWPVSHSLSPRIHGHWLSVHGIPGHYVPLGIAPEDFEAAVRMLPRIGFVGANVTIPHKESALALADAVSERAQVIGAANTLMFVDGQIHADNTDAYGFMANLRQGVPDWQASRAPALVLGAGGAARAIVFALREAGVPEIRVANRTAARAADLAAEFGPAVTPIAWDDISEATADVGLVVNTTALGMAGQPPLDITLRCGAGTVVTDIVYAPLITPLLQQASDRGLPTVDGLGMLLHQAVPGFHRWFGVEPEVTEDLRRVVLA